ncbi:hypothetical protein K0M31_007766 [Melipona bicolor]|uniref:Uncharacterized protein n=1 Tax=Melipona bicolor TaxID=60889 RepID=A0AA40KVY8_9HYME|nr:hypothetical protein K0M31_007766 [Melipona bicolor]
MMSWVSATGMKWDDLLALGSRTVVQQAPTVYTPTDYQMRNSSCGSSYECVSRVNATFHVHANEASHVLPFFPPTRTPETKNPLAIYDYSKESKFGTIRAFIMLEMG